MNTRKAAVLVAAVVAAAVLLGGTFAWTSISQQAKNETIVDINPGGRLHDDFNGQNKDVYVENFGDELTGVPIFARIRLDEYMEIGTDAGKNKDAPLSDRNVQIIAPDGYSPLINDVSTWITYIPGDTDRVYGAYWDWQLGNDADNMPYYMPTFNRNKDSLLADINGTLEGKTLNDGISYDDYVTYGPGDSTTTDATYDWDEDTTEEATPTVTRNPDDPKDSADVFKTEETHEATEISSTATVITMQEWITVYGSQPGPYWVYDTDGWAYWANPIMPGETTGLLLDGINMTAAPGDGWYYGINVVGQFATASDWEVFAEVDSGEMTQNARDLMDIITRVTPASP